MSEARIESYRDLKVWQLALDIAQDCYEMTREFPKEEIYGITSQMRRAALSVAANIAEGYGRETRGSFVQFLRMAQGSLKELETHALLAGRIGLMRDSDGMRLMGRCEDCGKMLRSLIRVVQRRQVDG